MAQEVEYMTLEEVMAYLGVSRSSIDSYVRQGKLKRYHRGAPARETIFKRAQVEALTRIEPRKPRKQKPKEE